MDKESLLKKVRALLKLAENNTNVNKVPENRVDELENLLSSIVWVQPTHNGSPSCSYCGNQKHWGHSEDCKLKEFDSECK